MLPVYPFIHTRYASYTPDTASTVRDHEITEFNGVQMQVELPTINFKETRNYRAGEEDPATIGWLLGGGSRAPALETVNPRLLTSHPPFI